MKHVTTIDPDLPFLETLASELWTQTGGDGFRLSKYLILLPTRRSRSLLGTAFAKIGNGKPVLLPRMRPLGDVDEDEMSFADDAFPDQLPAIPPLKRLMLLTQLVKRRDPEMSWDQAALSADALARFLDQLQIDQGDITKLPTLIEEQQLAQHWQETLTFLEIVTRNWPAILKDLGCQDPMERRNAVMSAQAALWKKAPPDFPIVAAGSTGSVSTTATLLEVISELPQGTVVLPGLDRAMSTADWDALDETHPQFTMKRLLQKLSVDRKNVTDFSSSSRPPSPRVALLNEAMRPANSTDEWRRLQGNLSTESIKGLMRLTLDHPQEEAQVIAIRMRAVLEEPNKTAAFVTADRDLARRVASLLQRWDIKIDDSGGAPVKNLPVGSFLSLLLAAASPHAGAVDLLALLKHPFAACGYSTSACRAKAREAEVLLRRLQQDEFDWLRKQLQPLAENWNTPLPLNERIALHISIAEKIAASDTEKGAMRLWQDESGEDAALWLDEWRQSAESFPDTLGNDYEALFNSLASMKVLRSVRATHPRLSILGQLESRMCDADLIILGGLNEGIWPPDAGFDPWMSRPMRKKLNLSLPEYRIGLSSHDFVQLCSANEVMLTRSSRANGVPTVPSRFLMQIDAVLQAAGLQNEKQPDILTPTEPWRDWAKALDLPEAPPKPCDRPQPCPPVELRPKALSVTKITTWLRNPYAIYAEHILKLKKLDELDAELDNSDKGDMIHEALESFTKKHPKILPPDAEATLLAIGREIFSREKDPRVRAFWEAGFEKIAGWFVKTDRTRRDTEVASVLAELKGAHELSSFTLTGRADRVERLSDGSVKIIDYKTGTVPKKEDVESGIEPQLQLLALIAANGGFKELSACAVPACEYWALKGGKTESEIASFDKKLPDLMEKAEEGLKSLIAEFANPRTVYEATPRASVQPKYNNYAHLSRIAEWNKSGGNT